MRSGSPVRRSLLFVVAVTLIFWGAAPAYAAAKHRVIVQLELSGSSCPSPLVLVGAESCEASSIADEIESELAAAGLNGPLSPFCGFASPNERWECTWSTPSGCTQKRATVTAESGDLCTSVSVTATSHKPQSFGGGSAGFLFFSIP